MIPVANGIHDFNSNEVKSLESLPNDILEKIFRLFLGNRFQLAQIATVSKRFNVICKHISQQNNEKKNVRIQIRDEPPGIVIHQNGQDVTNTMQL
jgi:hypothetical protein